MAAVGGEVGGRDRAVESDTTIAVEVATMTAAADATTTGATTVAMITTGATTAATTTGIAVDAVRWSLLVVANCYCMLLTTTFNVVGK